MAKDIPSPNPKSINAEASKPIITRQSEDGPAFTIGDDEFGSWADDDDDDER